MENRTQSADCDLRHGLTYKLLLLAEAQSMRPLHPLSLCDSDILTTKTFVHALFQYL